MSNRRGVTCSRTPTHRRMGALALACLTSLAGCAEPQAINGGQKRVEEFFAEQPGPVRQVWLRHDEAGVAHALDGEATITLLFPERAVKDSGGSFDVPTMASADFPLDAFFSRAEELASVCNADDYFVGALAASTSATLMSLSCGEYYGTVMFLNDREVLPYAEVLSLETLTVLCEEARELSPSPRVRSIEFTHDLGPDAAVHLVPDGGSDDCAIVWRRDFREPSESDSYCSDADDGDVDGPFALEDVTPESVWATILAVISELDLSTVTQLDSAEISVTDGVLMLNARAGDRELSIPLD